MRELGGDVLIASDQLCHPLSEEIVHDDLESGACDLRSLGQLAQSHTIAVGLVQCLEDTMLLRKTRDHQTKWLEKGCSISIQQY